MKRTREAAVARARKYPLPDDLETVSEQPLRRLNKPQLQELAGKLGLSTEVQKSSSAPAVEAEDAVVENRGSEAGMKTENGGDDNVTAQTTRGSKTADITVDGLKNVDSTTEEVPSASRRKKWLVTDPSEIPPHYYHRDLYRANFPLIDVKDVPRGYSFPVRDKFEGVVLDDNITEEARALWISRVFDAADGYKVPENEKQAFPMHFSFLEKLKMLTRPSRYDIDNHNMACGKRKWRYEDMKDIGRPKIRKVEIEEHEGMYLVPDGEDVAEPLGANRSDGDDSGLLLAPEEGVEMTGDLQEDEDTPPSGFADGVLHTFAKPVLDMMAGGNPDRVVAVLQRKFTEDKFKWNARFQGGFYAAKHCMENLRKGHGSAIYVLVMTSSTWSYGILVPEGYVQVRDGSIVESSMQQFQKHQAMTKNHTMSYEMLRDKLRAGTDFYQRCYRDNPSAVYKDGPMLVAKFYISSTWYNLPRPVCGGSKEEGGRRLFDGLLRLVIGDSVMDLSEEDFQSRMNR